MVAFIVLSNYCFGGHSLFVIGWEPTLHFKCYGNAYFCC